MSLFSDINGFNAKAMKNIYETRDENKEDFSEVDFCLNENEDNICGNQGYNSINSCIRFEDEIYTNYEEEETNGIDTEG